MLNQILLDSNYYIHDSNYPQRTIAYFNLGFNIICTYNNRPVIIYHSIYQTPLVGKVSYLQTIDNNITIKCYNGYFHFVIKDKVINPDIKICSKLVNE